MEKRVHERNHHGQIVDDLQLDSLLISSTLQQCHHHIVEATLTAELIHHLHVLLRYAVASAWQTVLTNLSTVVPAISFVLRLEFVVLHIVKDQILVLVIFLLVQFLFFSFFDLLAKNLSFHRWDLISLFE